MGCVGSRAREALLLAAEEAVKESAAKRLEALLTAPGPGGSDGLSASDLAQRHLLHQAAWLGHTACVRLLLEHGAEPGRLTELFSSLIMSKSVSTAARIDSTRPSLSLSLSPTTQSHPLTDFTYKYHPGAVRVKTPLNEKVRYREQIARQHSSQSNSMGVRNGVTKICHPQEDSPIRWRVAVVPVRSYV